MSLTYQATHLLDHLSEFLIKQTNWKHDLLFHFSSWEYFHFLFPFSVFVHTDTGKNRDTIWNDLFSQWQTGRESPIVCLHLYTKPVMTNFSARKGGWYKKNKKYDKLCFCSLWLKPLFIISQEILFHSYTFWFAVSEQMQKQIFKIVTQSIGNQFYKKAMECLKILRKESIVVWYFFPYLSEKYP